MKGRIAGWNASKLSFAGRTTLAQASLSSMPIYAMQTANLPLTTCDDMDKCIRGFIWDKSEEKKRMSLVGWDTICRAKSEGGLGFRHLRYVNDAFGVKLCWQIFSDPGSSWAKFICSKYDFDPSSELLPVLPTNASPLWRMICKCWGNMLNNVMWSLGNGKLVRFWLHCWVPGMSSRLSDYATRMVPSSLLYLTVSEFVNADKEWKWNLIESLLPPEIVARIAAILPPSCDQGVDIAYWGLMSDGKFSIKSCYYNLVESMGRGVEWKWSLIWHWYGPQRIKVFFWLLLNNGVMTNVERVYRQVADSNACGMCGNDEESSLHLLRDCNDANMTWRMLIRPGDMDWFFDRNHTLQEWLQLNLESSVVFESGVQWCTIFGVSCWYIWKKRNGFIFERERIPPSVVAANTMALAREVTKAKQRASGAGGGCHKQLQTVAWRKPAPGWCKLNSDASLLDGGEDAFGGGLVRDSEGMWKSGYVVNIGSCSILLAEIWCMLYGVSHCLELGVRKVCVECDNLSAVEMVKGNHTVNAQCRQLVKRIRLLLQNFEASSVEHVHREGNFAADFLSHHAYSFERGFHVLNEQPQGIYKWIQHDHLGISYSR